MKVSYFKSSMISLKDMFLNAYHFKGTTDRQSYWLATSTLLMIALVLSLYPIIFYITSNMYFSLSLFIIYGLMAPNVFFLSVFMYALLIFSYLVAIPYLAMLSRRLNDAGFSGLYIVLFTLFFLPQSLFKLIIVLIIIGLFIFMTLVPSIK